MQTRVPTDELVRRAWQAGLVVPAFNIPYLPMMEPVVSALRDAESFGLIAVARLEWEKFEAGGPAEIHAEYQQVKDERYTRLHLDHVPVVDEDQQPAPYLEIIRGALELGFESVMVDGSRLPMAENIAATRTVVEMAHAAGVPVEAELGAVLGHESGPLPPYEELFASGQGFTDPEEAGKFVRETGVDWLSVAIGNIHGAISGAASARRKPEARLNIERLRALAQATGVPLVLHGGSGIRKQSILEAVRSGIAKINVAATLRRAYESARDGSLVAAQQAVYDATMRVLTEELDVAGSALRINPQGE